MDPDERARLSAEVFGVLARTVHRTAQEAATILRAEGLNPAQFQLLLAVRRDPEEFQHHVGQRLGVTRPPSRCW